MKTKLILLSIFKIALISPSSFAVEGPMKPLISDPILQSKSKHHVRLLNTGEEALLARIHLIRMATKSIVIQSFIWKNDETSRYITYELLKAAKRGVKIRILVDYFGIEKEVGIMAFLSQAHPNLSIKVFNPTSNTLVEAMSNKVLTWATEFTRMNQRMHNKLFLVDNEVGIVGGRNYENLYFDRNIHGKNFKDRDILVIGSEVQEMKASFEIYWNFERSVEALALKDIKNSIEKGMASISSIDLRIEDYFSDVETRASNLDYIEHDFNSTFMLVESLEFFADSPNKNNKKSLTASGITTQKFAQILNQSKSEILIESPYFIMNKSMKTYFSNLRKEKPSINISVVTNSFGSTDNALAYAMVYKNKPYYVAELGIEIYEVKPLPFEAEKIIPGFYHLWVMAHRDDPTLAKPFLSLHAKSFVVDEEIGVVGSFNFDPRSAHINTELAVVIKDDKFAKTLKMDIDRDRATYNAWVVASANTESYLSAANQWIENQFSKLPIDMWPLRTFQMFELKPGMLPVPISHPDFYLHYQSVGNFPIQSSGNAQSVLTRVIKALGGGFEDLY